MSIFVILMIVVLAVIFIVALATSILVLFGDQLDIFARYMSNRFDVGTKMAIKLKK